MFYSGWQFRTPALFELSPLVGGGGTTATAAVAASGGGAAAGAAVSAGAPVVVVQRVESTAPTSSGGGGSGPSASASASASSPPWLVNSGVVHLDVTPRVSFIGQGAAAAGHGLHRHTAASRGAFHTRTSVPLMPQLGLAYMEVQLEALNTGTDGNSNSNSTSSASPVLPPPAIVVGLCTDSLPPHRLPGEQEGSAGLFLAQAMVYADGSTEGERVRLPLSQQQQQLSGASSPPTTASAVAGAAAVVPPLRAYFNYRRRRRSSSSSSSSKGDVASTATTTAASPTTAAGTAAAAVARARRRELQVGDVLGVLVDFISGTLRFTYNGSLVEGYTGKIPKAEQQGGIRRSGGGGALVGGLPSNINNSSSAASYYFAVGLQRKPAAQFTLKVIFQSGVLPNPGVRVLRPATGQDGSNNSSGGATNMDDDDDTVYEGDLVAYDVAGHAAREAASQLRRQHPRLGDKGWREPQLSDAAVHGLLRQFLAARGMTRTLASLDREATELTTPARHDDDNGEAVEDDSGTAREEEDLLAQYSETIATARRQMLGEPRPADGNGTGNGPASTPLSSSSSSQQPFTPSFLLENCAVLPTHRHALYAALRGRGSLTHNRHPHRQQEGGGSEEEEQQQRHPSLSADRELVPSSLWGLLLYSRRTDLLFTLKALQAAELTLDTCDSYLAHIKVKHCRGGGASAARSVFDAPAAVEARLLAAYSAAVIVPLEELKRHAASGKHTSANGNTAGRPVSNATAAATVPAKAATAPTAAESATSRLAAKKALLISSDAPPSPQQQQQQQQVRMQSWEELSHLPYESLVTCFLTCLTEGDSDHTTTTNNNSLTARAECAASILMTAAMPRLSAPSTAVQLRLGESLVSYFSHTHAFFSELTRQSPQRPAARSHDGDSGDDGCPENSSSSDRRQLLETCLANWTALAATARRHFCRGAYATLQRALEEVNTWIGRTLCDWLARAETQALASASASAAATRSATAETRDRVWLRRRRQQQQQRAIARARADVASRMPLGMGIDPVADEDAETEEEEYSCSDLDSAHGVTAPSPPRRAAATSNSSSSSSPLAQLSRGPTLPPYLGTDPAPPTTNDGSTGASATSITSTMALLLKMPPQLPTLRGLHRRCLAAASLDPLEQASTAFFLARLRAAVSNSSGPAASAGVSGGRKRTSAAVEAGADGNTSSTSTHVAGGGSGQVNGTGENGSSHAGTAAALACGAANPRAGWAADEFYMASVHLRQVHRLIFP